jgi:choline dehydrogenase-like flavoprotein
VARIVILGAGVCGLAAALLLRRDGHEVTVLERDPAPAPESVSGAWEGWARDGVTQFRQPHILMPRGGGVLGAALADVATALEGAGGLRLDLLELMPPTIADRDAPRRGRALSHDHRPPARARAGPPPRGAK